MYRYVLNPYRHDHPDWPGQETTAFRQSDIRKVHRSLREYQPTPLVELPVLAGSLNVGRILVKDEAYRFGLKAFKALGSTYAVFRYIRDYLTGQGKTPPSPDAFYRQSDFIAPNRFTFCTATDGNHGRGVAWTARKLNQKAVIFMPSETVRARIDNIRAEGAEVIIVDGNYDDAVCMAIDEAGRHGWVIISDTSWMGYEDISRNIMAGYLTMFEEIEETLDIRPDVVLVQAGVGALAAAASWHYNQRPDLQRVKLVSVEPPDAACLLESIASPDGHPITCRGTQKSIMAGLNCGTPSPVAWPFIRDGFDLFMTVPDEYSLKAMRRYYFPERDDSCVISGESGAAGLAALLALNEMSVLKPVREMLGISKDTTILLLNTEGDTDPKHFEKVIRGNSEHTT